jgi:hypothetical protein
MKRRELHVEAKLYGTPNSLYFIQHNRCLTLQNYEDLWRRTFEFVVQWQRLSFSYRPLWIGFAIFVVFADWNECIFWKILHENNEDHRHCINNLNFVLHLHFFWFIRYWKKPINCYKLQSFWLVLEGYPLRILTRIPNSLIEIFSLPPEIFWDRNSKFIRVISFHFSSELVFHCYSYYLHPYTLSC